MNMPNLGKIAMRTLALCSIYVALLSNAHAQAAAPEFSLPSLTEPSTTISLQQLHGKLVYLDFWASWCAPCKRSFPWMNQLQKTYGPQGLQIITINLDTKRDDALSFLQSTPGEFLIAYDAAGTSAQAYAIKGMPSSFLIDRHGNVLHRHAGYNAKIALAVEAEIKAALSTTPVSNSASNSASPH